MSEIDATYQIELPPGIKLTSQLLKFPETTVTTKSVSATYIETTLKPPGPLLFPVIMAGLSYFAFSDLGTGWGVGIAILGTISTIVIFLIAPRLHRLVLNVSGAPQIVYRDIDLAKVQALKGRVEAIVLEATDPSTLAGGDVK
jgi:hypothetical protein